MIVKVEKQENYFFPEKEIIRSCPLAQVSTGIPGKYCKER